MHLEALASIIREQAAGATRVAVALSGGVDSGLVAAAAGKAMGNRAATCTVISELTARNDLTRAEEVALKIGLEHHMARISVLVEPGVRENMPDRCYHCKSLIFRAIKSALGADCLLLDGTNAGDDPTRPGLRAGREFRVFSPLAAAGLHKAAIRESARSAGLPNWDAPAESCLATRIRTGTALSQTGLKRVEAMESFLHSLGITSVRARHDNLVATVEFFPQYAGIMKENRDKIVAFCTGIGLRSCVYQELEQ